MKKFFNFFGLFILLCFSFIYTEKTANAVKDLDTIMIQIKENVDIKKENPIEALIGEDSIIPGINGKEIDINKSYETMRSIGTYNEKYLKYKNIEVKNRLKNNKNKYIVNGNQYKNEVSLIFIVEEKSKIDKVMDILEDSDIKATFFLDGNWLEKNNSKIYEIVNEGHLIGSIGYNYDYNDSSYLWLDSIIKRVLKTKENYCIRTDDKGLLVCSKNKNYTVDPIIINSTPIYNTKENLKKGAMLAYKITSYLDRDLKYIIEYIEKKGYKIVLLNNLLEE